MRWPWTEAAELRQQRELERRSYTDQVLELLRARVESGSTAAVPGATAALEAAAGFVSRAFASAEVSAPSPVAEVLGPSTLALVGRELIRAGEAVFIINTEDGRLRLLPCESYDVQGDSDPSSWRYRLHIGGPSKSTTTYNDVAADGVVHVRYSVSTSEPWRGKSPLEVASLGGRLSAETSAALSDESSGPRGAFLPIPSDGQDPTVMKLREDIAGARGRLMLTESGDWDRSGGDRGASWRAERFGADPPAPLVDLHQRATSEVLAACGLSASLWLEGDGTGRREAYRQALHSVVSPLGKIAEEEFRKKLEVDVTLDWHELRAADVAGRARAFQSLVGGGMSIEDAARQAGLLVED